MIRRPFRTICFASALIGAILPEPGRAQGDRDGTTPAYVLVPRSAKRIKAVLTFEVKAPKAEAEEWSVYVVQAPALPGQVNVRTTLFPRGKAARELSDEGRPMLYVRIPPVGPRGGQELSARVEYEATLLDRRLDRREPGDPEPPAVAPLDPKTRRLELANGHQFDYQSAPFRAWLDAQQLRRGPMEDEVEYARRAFLVVRKGIKHYEGADVEHLASRVCEVGKSDYAGITAVYVAALRANGIPTRVLSGRTAILKGERTGTAWPHAKVEFVPGIGWVPADVAGAIRFNTSPDGLEYFGSDFSEFLTMHLDTDLIIDTYFGRKTIEWLPSVSWWVLGSGSFDGSKTKDTMTVEVEPLDLTEALSRKPARPGAGKPAAKPNRSPR